MPLQRRYVMRDMRIVRANLEAKYRLGKSLPHKPAVFGDSPVPLAKYVDVSMSINYVHSVKSLCFVNCNQIAYSLFCSLFLSDTMHSHYAHVHCNHCIGRILWSHQHWDASPVLQSGF